MKTIHFAVLTVLCLTVLCFLKNAFAQGAPPLRVRVLYFLPNDRAPQPDIDANLDELLKASAKFFADKMEVHGFGRKTFRLETDSSGHLKVHRVNGAFGDSHYYHQTWEKVWNEIDGAFDTSRDIYLAVIDISLNGFQSTSGHGLICGRGGVHETRGGRVILPAAGRCFEEDGFIVVAHELGHAFGLFHDFRKDVYLMSYGRFRDALSRCSAEWLDVHPYFNRRRTTVDRPTAVEVLPLRVSPPDSIVFRFKVTDADGLRQIQFLKPATGLHEAPGEPKLIDYKHINAKKSQTVEFLTSQFTSKNEADVILQSIDVGGNATTQGFRIDISAFLPPRAVVSIPDAHLAIAIREKLGVAPRTPITQRDMLGLTELFLDYRQIHNLTGIQHARHLKILSLHQDPLGDLTPLAKLPGLQHLFLSECQIDDLTPLQGLTSLTVLNLDKNQITDLTSLRDLVHLRWLSLSDNQITDLTPLRKLTLLRRLYLWGNEITDLTPLTDFTALEILYLGENPIRDLTPLAGVTRLNYLYLWGNGISDLTPLAGLKHLEQLFMGANQITDLTPLTGLTQLRELNLSYNQLRDITPLRKITALTRLVLSNNDITDITPLAHLTKLERVWLTGNQIQDVSPLVNLENLSALHLQGNPIEDVAPLRSLLERYPSLHLDIMHTLYAVEKITGPYLWIIAPTEKWRGGIESLDVDSLHGASNGTLREAEVAQNGAKAGDAVGDYVWTLGSIAPTGGNNLNDLVNKIGIVDGGNSTTTADDVNIVDHSAYGIISLKSTTGASDVTMLAGCNDAMKIWLNGDVVFKNQHHTNWAATDFQERFKVNLKKGKNLLMVKVSQGTGDWSLFVGIDAEVTLKTPLAAPMLSTSQLMRRPEKTALLANYPNPFNPETWIPYELTAASDVAIVIFDMRGIAIRRLSVGHQPAGVYKRRSRAAYWDGRNEAGEPVASGVYFYTLTAGEFTATRKLLMKK